MIHLEKDWEGNEMTVNEKIKDLVIFQFKEAHLTLCKVIGIDMLLIIFSPIRSQFWSQ